MTLAPPLRYRRRYLANGLEVYALRDDKTASVAVQVWYGVGSKDDPADRSGFAHLFEHMMFKATRQMPAEFIDRLTEDVGGFNNASTYDDFTNYYEVAPANHLERLLWAEASRMGSLIVDEDGFRAERDVVKEELRQRIFAAPYGRLFYYYLAQANYDVHPYGRPGIGSIQDLDKATLDDVRAFHSAYYRPDNARLIVSGRFDDVALDAMVDRYFGAIAAPDQPVPRLDVSEPARRAPKALTTTAPNVPLPAVTVSYPGVSAGAPDLAAIMVLEGALARGDSSRLYGALVYEAGLASEVFTIMEPTRDVSVLTIGAILSEGVSPDDGERALRAVIDRLRREKITEAELDEARNEILSDRFEARETASGRAYELAESVMRFDDAAAADRLLAQIAATTADEVQAAALRLFREEAAVYLRYVDEQEADKAAVALSTSNAIKALPLSALDVRPAAARDALPTEPPAPGPAIAPAQPAWTERRLANGLRVVIAVRAGVRVVNGVLRVSGGDAHDPARLAGLGDHAAALTLRGAGERSAMELAAAIERLGASISAGADKDTSYASFFTRSDALGATLDLLADTVLRPHFDDAELIRQRQIALDDLAVSIGEPSFIAGRALARALYGAHGYGSAATFSSLAAIDTPSIRARHAAAWRPDAATLTLAGDIDPEAAFAQIGARFGDWSGAADATALAGTANAGGETILIDMPGAGQAAVYTGLIGPARSAPDFLHTLLATAVLGGGYSARLNMEVRVKRGLSYGAGASLSERRGDGAVVAGAQTRNDAAVDVLKLFEDGFANFAKEPPTDVEMTARKASLTGQFARDVETSGGLCGRLSSLDALGLPLDDVTRYTEEIERLDRNGVVAAASTYFVRDRLCSVIVGDGETIAPALKSYAPKARRMTLADLGLDDPDAE